MRERPLRARVFPRSKKQGFIPRERVCRSPDILSRHGELVSLRQGFVPYVLELQPEDPDGGISLAICLVVLKRTAGFMLAVPVGYLQDEILEQSETVGEEEVLGPSKIVRVAAGIWGENGISEIEDSTVSVVLLDVLAEAAGRLKVYQPGVEDDVIHFFVGDRTDVYPMVFRLQQTELLFTRQRRRKKCPPRRHLRTFQRKDLWVQK